MARTKFAQTLFDEFESRRLRNPRYSLRAFAKFLKTDHSSLAQILRGTRRVPSKHIREWSAALQFEAEESMVYSAMESMPTSELAARHERLKHWTSEASAITANKLHWQILKLSREHDFAPDTRWIAKRTGCNVDEVNIALARLLDCVCSLSTKSAGPNLPAQRNRLKKNSAAWCWRESEKNWLGRTSYQTRDKSRRNECRIP